MKTCWKFSTKRMAWLALLLMVSFIGGGCQSAQQRAVFSPLPADTIPPGEHRLSPCWPSIPGEQRVYYVGGQVRSPGRQLYMGATTVTKAIQSAGDFTDFAASKRVVLTRSDGKTFQVDCSKVAHNPSLDLPVYPGDKIVVPQHTLWDWFR